jgi:cbb3-type cytochrome oxidase cytochrome c subunit
LTDSYFAIFIHDGQSKGTSNELKLAKKMGVPYSFHELEPAKHDKSVGFDIQLDWDKLNLETDLSGL